MGLIIGESLEKLRDQPSCFGITLSPIGSQDKMMFCGDLLGNTEVCSIY